jgi:hypothetical protein
MTAHATNSRVLTFFAGDIILVTLWLWLSSSAVHGGVLRQIRELEDEVVPACLTYRLNSLIHVDCSDRDLTELPEGINENVKT